jgi:ATP-dependent Clp protease ATP-binding subunit ClpC
MRQIGQILNMELDELSIRLKEHGYSLKVLPAAKKLLTEKGWDQKYGARPMRRAIQKELEEPLARLMLEKDFSVETCFVVSALKKKIFIRSALRESAAEGSINETVKFNSEYKK